MTSLKENVKMQELVGFGLFEAIIGIVAGEKDWLEKSELGIMILCNAVADQDKMKIELMAVEEVRG